MRRSLSKLYYENWRDEAYLPMKTNIQACKVTPCPIRKSANKRDGRLAVIHNGDWRKDALDRRIINASLGQCLADNAIILFASTEGVTIEPITIQHSIGLNCHVFGINRLPAGSPASFLTVDEWKEIFAWANTDADRTSIERLKLQASETVIRLLWPSGWIKRGIMALAVLCDGYLSRCNGRNAQSGSDNAGSEKNADWWLRVFVEGGERGIRTEVERGEAILVIESLLSKEGTSEMSHAAKEFLGMLRSGAVNNAKAVSAFHDEIAKDLQ